MLSLGAIRYCYMWDLKFKRKISDTTNRYCINYDLEIGDPLQSFEHHQPNIPQPLLPFPVIAHVVSGGNGGVNSINQRQFVGRENAGC